MVYLTTIVPPVATAVRNLRKTNIQNQGENAAETPANNCIVTAITKTPRLPYLKKEIA